MMNEPAGSVANAITAGVGGLVLSTLGLEPAQMFWALVGASLGMSFAAASTRTRAAVVFICVVLVCSLFGAYIASFTSGGVIAKNTFACGLAICFHPLLNAAITRLPAALDGLMRKIGLGSSQ